MAVTLSSALDTLEMLGSMSEENDSGSTITVTTAGTYYGWTTASDGNSHNVTFSSDATADRLTIPTGGDGTYKADGSFSFSGTISATILGVLHKNGSPDTTVKFRRKIGTGGDTGNSGVTGDIVLAAGDYVDFRFTSDSNGDVVNILSASLVIRRVKRS